MASVLNLWIGVYSSFFGYIFDFYQRSWIFILLGCVAGIFFAESSVRNAYKDCQNKIDAFSWPSKEARQKSEELMSRVVTLTLVAVVSLVIFILINYFFFYPSLLYSLTYILNIVSMFAIGPFLVTVIMLAPSLLLDIIFGNFLQSLYQKLFDLSK